MTARIRRGARPEEIIARGKRVVVERRAVQPSKPRRGGGAAAGLSRIPAPLEAANRDVGPLAADLARILAHAPLRFPMILFGRVL